jgi:hypothetical protein
MHHLSPCGRILSLNPLYLHRPPTHALLPPPHLIPVIQHRPIFRRPNCASAGARPSAACSTLSPSARCSARISRYFCVSLGCDYWDCSWVVAVVVCAIHVWIGRCRYRCNVVCDALLVVGFSGYWKDFLFLVYLARLHRIDNTVHTHIFLPSALAADSLQYGAVVLLLWSRRRRRRRRRR